jgi:hypothetical protein
MRLSDNVTESVSPFHGSSQLEILASQSASFQRITDDNTQIFYLEWLGQVVISPFTNRTYRIVRRRVGGYGNDGLDPESVFL